MLIGETTAGAAHPGRPYPVNAFFEITIPNGQVRSGVKGGNWEGSGVKPDVAVPAADALRVAHTGAIDRLRAGADENTREYLEKAKQQPPPH